LYLTGFHEPLNRNVKIWFVIDSTGIDIREGRPHNLGLSRPVMCSVLAWSRVFAFALLLSAFTLSKAQEDTLCQSLLSLRIQS
jgi:hypothetical protein